MSLKARTNNKQDRRPLIYDANSSLFLSWLALEFLLIEQESFPIDRRLTAIYYGFRPHYYLLLTKKMS